MYKQNKMAKSSLTSVEILEGETIEQKVRRITEQKEPIKDGAPEIFTERSEGVVAAYNIRTDRFEVAAEAMDKISRSTEAKRAEKQKAKEDAQKAAKEGVIDINKGKNDGGAEPTVGKSQGDTK